MRDIEDSFDGNLCRCTGYRPILESAKSLSKEFTNDSSSLVNFSEMTPYDPSLDPSFPVELINKDIISKSLRIINQKTSWIEVECLEELLNVFKTYHDYQRILVAGFTHFKSDFKKIVYQNETKIAFINISNLREMKIVNFDYNCLELGASLTVTELQSELTKLKDLKNEFLNAFEGILSKFGTRQVRNFATIGGNLCGAVIKSVSDFLPILLCHNASLSLMSHSGEKRTVSLSEFYQENGTTILKNNEILLKIIIPMSNKDINKEFVKYYKHSKRKDNDYAILNACFRMKLDLDTPKIENLIIVYGGIAPSHIKFSLENLDNKKLGDELSLASIQEEILDKITSASTSTFKKTLAVSFFTRFWHQIMKEMNLNVDLNIDEIHRDVSKGKQEIGSLDSKIDKHIGAPYTHAAGLKHATGFATYLDDVPSQVGELNVGLVLSTKAHALIKKIDPSKALELKGVACFVDHRDVPQGLNKFGHAMDEELLASNEVHFYGQIIGIIVAESRQLARYAASLVQIEYEPLKGVFTISDAVENDSFFKHDTKFQRGEFDGSTFNVDNSENDFIFEGKLNLFPKFNIMYKVYVNSSKNNE